MRVTVQYEYDCEGHLHRGDRGGLEPFAARNHERYRELEAAKQNKRAVNVWVNPEHPSEALFAPAVRWIAIAAYMATGALLTGIGFGLLVLLGRAGRPSKPP